MFKYLTRFVILLSVFVCFNGLAFSKTVKIVSLSPSVTEIIYAIDAQDTLVGVSSGCNYPVEAKNKTVVGDSYFINKEKIIKLHPDYVFSVEATRGTFNEFKYTDITPVELKMNSIQDIYANIEYVGNLTGKTKQAKSLVATLKQKTSKFKTTSPKKVLYLVQTNPMITIGKKSFIASVIKQSGNILVTDFLNEYYPVISMEFAVKSNPDVVVVGFCSDEKQLKKFFPHSKIVVLNSELRDIINRPSPRFYKSLEFFSKL